jgi:hypothetical protein
MCFKSKFLCIFIPAGTRRRFDVEISSKWSRDVDRLNIDIISTSPWRRIIDVVYKELSKLQKQRCFDVVLTSLWRRRNSDQIIFYQWKWSNLIGWGAFQSGPVFCIRPALKRNCPLWNATARSGFRAKNWGVKQFLNEKICQKRLKNIA